LDHTFPYIINVGPLEDKRLDYKDPFISFAM